MATVEFQDVSKVYPDGTQAVDSLDLMIDEGEFMVFVGPSGCGKTTALRMVAGLAEIKKIQRTLGVTTIYVTHDQTEAMTMGDRIAVMRGGTLQQVDTPERVYQWPANQFVAGFIGSPAMNMIRARVTSADGRLCLR